MQVKKERKEKAEKQVSATRLLAGARGIHSLRGEKEREREGEKQKGR
jgi:hypothetical protein